MQKLHISQSHPTLTAFSDEVSWVRGAGEGREGLCGSGWVEAGGAGVSDAFEEGGVPYRIADLLLYF